MEEYEVEIELTKLMQDLQKVAIKIEDVSAPYVAIIEKAVKDEEEAVKEYSKISVEIQNKITGLTILRAKSLKTGSGNITYRKGAVRRSWNLDALDKVCLEDSDIKERIWDYRKESISEPQVLIKVETKGKSVSDI